MSKDRSLQNIDITKLLIYILVFISACLIMIFGFLVPNIQEYKRIKYDKRVQIAASTQINQVYNVKQEALDKLK